MSNHTYTHSTHNSHVFFFPHLKFQKRFFKKKQKTNAYFTTDVRGYPTQPECPGPWLDLSFIWAVNDHHLCAFSFLNNTYKWTFGPIFLCAFCTMFLECPSARQRQGQSLLPSLSAHQTPLSLGAL